MRTNIVIDESLIKEAQRLTHLRSKREIVNVALQELVKSRREKQKPRQLFFNTYISQPIVLEDFKPMLRDDIYAR